MSDEDIKHIRFAASDASGKGYVYSPYVPIYNSPRTFVPKDPFLETTRIGIDYDSQVVYILNSPARLDPDTFMIIVDAIDSVSGKKREMVYPRDFEKSDHRHIPIRVMKTGLEAINLAMSSDEKWLSDGIMAAMENEDGR